VGYTHYWYRPRELDAASFAEASRDCAMLADAVRDSIALRDASGEGQPRFEESVIAYDRRLCRRVLGYGAEFRLALPDADGSPS
jgi:hypothetical protein